MARVLVAVPTFETIAPETFKSIWDMDRGGHEVDFDFVRGYDCARARTLIAVKAKEYDYVLMVDSDIIVPGDALVNLISHGVGVCTGFYARKGSDDGRTTLCELGRRDYDVNLMADELREMRVNGEHLIEVKGGAAGCMLVKSEVFGKLQYPYFNFVTYADGKRALSEDYYFCSQCRKAGVKVYADTRVACKHRFVEWKEAV